MFLSLIIIILFLYFLFIINVLIMAGRDLPTSRKAKKNILGIIVNNLGNKKDFNFCDLGCGRGDVLFAVRKTFPRAFVFGIEKSFFQLFFAKLQTFFLRQKIFFQKGDFFEKNLEKANIIYCYLPKALLTRLEEKLKNELKKGTLIITNTTHFLNWKPNEVFIVHKDKPDFEKLFVYIKD